MKKLLLVFLLGITTHMLYLDAIAIRQDYIIDNCPMNEKPNKDGILPCLKYGNDTWKRAKGKYFNLTSLIPWKNLVTGPWRME